MNKRICFLGHRYVNKFKIESKLYNLIESEILNGNTHFSMGTKGDFNALTLKICRKLRDKYPFIEIEVIITSLCTIKKEVYEDNLGKIVYPSNYDDVKTIMYDIEEIYFKRRIIESNYRMIDNSDVLICFVDVKRSGGAKYGYKYALKNKKEIINLFDGY